MPNSAPAKVATSPKPISRLSCISPSGSMHTPQNSSPSPPRLNIAAVISCMFIRCFIFPFVLFPAVFRRICLRLLARHPMPVPLAVHPSPALPSRESVPPLEGRLGGVLIFKSAAKLLLFSPSCWCFPPIVVFKSWSENPTVYFPVDALAEVW